VKVPGKGEKANEIPGKSRKKPEGEIAQSSETLLIINCINYYNCPSPGGRELEGGGKLAEFTLTLTLSHRGRGILYGSLTP